MSSKAPQGQDSASRHPGSRQAPQQPPGVEPGPRELDFGDPAFYSDPFPALARLRSTAPIHPVMTLADGRRAWLVTSFDDAAQVLKHPHISTVPLPGHAPVPGPPIMMRLMQPNMLAMDPPDHTRLRALLSRAFTPRFIQGLRPHIQHITDALIDRVLPRGEMEFISDFAFPLPITVIAEMLGIPLADRARLRDWSAVLFDSIAGHEDARSHARADELADYITALIETKRRRPRADLVSQLVQAEEAGSRLDAQELRAMIVLLIFAGHETTAHLLGNGMLALLTHPDQRDRLRRDPSLVPAAVEELLRFCGPVLVPALRYATADVDIGGTRLPRGAVLLVAIPAANRDQARFPGAETLDITRTSSKHLAFGQGIHYCLGAPLARLEAQVALSTLLRRLPGLRLSVPPDALRWRGNMALRGLHALPVAF